MLSTIGEDNSDIEGIIPNAQIVRTNTGIFTKMSITFGIPREQIISDFIQVPDVAVSGKAVFEKAEADRKMFKGDGSDKRGGEKKRAIRKMSNEEECNREVIEKRAPIRRMSIGEEGNKEASRKKKGIRKVSRGEETPNKEQMDDTLEKEQLDEAYLVPIDVFDDGILYNHSFIQACQKCGYEEKVAVMTMSMTEHVEGCPYYGKGILERKLRFGKYTSGSIDNCKIVKEGEYFVTYGRALAVVDIRNNFGIIFWDRKKRRALVGNIFELGVRVLGDDLDIFNSGLREINDDDLGNWTKLEVFLCGGNRSSIIEAMKMVSLIHNDNRCKIVGAHLIDEDINTVAINPIDGEIYLNFEHCHKRSNSMKSMKKKGVIGKKLSV